MSEDLLFNAEDTVAPAAAHGVWTVLIVDDDAEVHSVTTLALAGFAFAGKPLRFLHAHSGAEARVLLASRSDIALVLLDVVMETDHAGLELVEHVRNRIGNRFIRIILRTGQPGQAPELEVITKYDINDYKYKTELTRERLFTAVYTGLSTYRDLVALEASRRGLEKVIEASARIFELRELEHFAQGVLEQLAALLFFDCDALMVDVSGLAAAATPDNFRIIAGTGAYRDSVDRDASALPAPVLARMREALSRQAWTCGDDYFVAHRADATGAELVFYVDAGVQLPPPDRHLLELFCRNVMIARENLRILGSERGNAA
jgi:CheY-like chemotaxis protein